MLTVSPELAKRLKVAGLTHTPQVGDMYLFYVPGTPSIKAHFNDCPVILDRGSCKPLEEDVWLPTQADLQHEIEDHGYGYGWSIACVETKQDGERYNVYLYRTAGLWRSQSFWASTPQDAMAQALIWTLEHQATLARMQASAIPFDDVLALYDLKRQDLEPEDDPTITN
jgi:hypothetical protein